MRSDGPADRPCLAIDGRAVPIVVLRHPRARGYRLRMGRDGTARLTMPARGAERCAVEWARSQADWIAGELDRMGSTGCRLRAGATFLLEGRPVAIAWGAALSRRIDRDGDRILVGGPEDRVGERVLRWLRSHARTVLTAETMALANAHGLTVRSVGIGDPSSRWGSCTADGAIRYSWRLILAPPEVRMATVAHELAHRVHMDHSPAFHALHRAICPTDTAAARAWLRANGSILHGVIA